MLKIAKLISTVILCILLTPEFTIAGNQINFATDSFPPYYYEEDGTPKGIQYELAKTVFNKMDTQIKIKFLPWKRAILIAETGKVDGIFGVIKTKERQKWLIYPEEPLMLVTVTIFKRADDPFTYTGVSSLKGKTVGIIKGYSYGEAFDNSTLFKKEEVKSIDQNFRKMLVDRVDLVAGYSVVGKHILKSMNLEDRIVSSQQAIHVTPIYVTFTRKPGHLRISEEFSRILKEYKMTEECQELMLRIGLPKNANSPCN
ncbi:MAG TPA: ABC transporter substrate-binding protein [Desulfovibrio sp.]|nr:ABC transporter substrate-binding protein [Desulfovibrio sp.]